MYYTVVGLKWLTPGVFFRFVFENFKNFLFKAKANNMKNDYERHYDFVTTLFKIGALQNKLRC